MQFLFLVPSTFLLLLFISSPVRSEPIVRVKSLKSIEGAAPFGEVDNCLSELKSKVCDPEGILSAEQLERLNEALVELEKATNVTFYPAPPLWEFLNAARCPSAGLSLTLVVVKKLAKPEQVTKQIADKHWRWTKAHPCAKTAVVLVEDGGAGEREEGGAEGQLKKRRSPSTALSNALLSESLMRDPRVRFSNKPILVGGQFVGISSANSDVPSLELARYYFNKKRELSDGQVTEALEGMVGDLRKNMMLRM